MAHQHSHPPAGADSSRAFAWSIGLNLAFVAVETASGLYADSLALLADAGHNLSDVLGLVLAWGATVLARRAPTAQRTYGLRRVTILAALANAILLLGAVGAIAWEAAGRLSAPPPAAGGWIMAVAGAGIVINLSSALLFRRGAAGDANLRAAFQHLLADAAVSLGVVLAGLAILWTGRLWIDPVVGLAVAAMIAWSGWPLLRTAFDLAADAVPAGVDRAAVENYLRGLPGVATLHDLHIWALSTTQSALTVHLVRSERADDNALLGQIRRDLHDRFGIEHATVQIEMSAEAGRTGEVCAEEGCGEPATPAAAGSGRSAHRHP